MIPIRDSTPRSSFPFINYLIILANIIVFYFQLTSPDFEQFVSQYGFIASNFNLFSLQTYQAIVTSLFLHGGFLHIIFNMWFLHIFGDNVEDALGHLPYLGFYLLGGIVASLTQYALDPHTSIPMIGASGAISAVAGAYFVLYRKSTILALVPLFIIWTTVELPIWFFLGYWFVSQLFSGLGSVVSVSAQTGGTAWFAHIGGFVFGYIVGQMVKPKVNTPSAAYT